MQGGGSVLTPPLLPRGLGVDSKPELQRVLEHRRRNQLIKKKKEELEAKRLQCPFEQELLRRQQRLNQVGGAPRPSPCFLQDYPLAQGGTRPAVTADEAKECVCGQPAALLCTGNAWSEEAD